jgi:glycosyltransferase involved in cell wall biosynthesis
MIVARTRELGPSRSRAETEQRPAHAVRRPRVLLVAPLPPPLGGVQLVADMQRRSRLAREFDLQVVDTSKHKLRWAVETPTIASPLYFIRDWFRLVRSLVRVRPDVALIHAAATVSLLRDWAFMLTARIAGAQVVCHYHGTLHARFPCCATRSGRFIGRLVMSAADRVIVVSPTYQREFSKAWRRDDLVWAPNPADVALFRGSPTHGESPWLEPGERAVLFVGRLSAPKGIYDLFAAIPAVVERHPNVRFLLMGVAECDAMEPALRADVERRGIAAHVRFLGPLTGRDKAAAFAAAELIVVPSWTEAFPLVIPEAMAAGLPIVATAVGAIPDFVEDGADGFLVMPKQPTELADRIGRLLGDEALRRRIAQRLRERAPREFAVDVAAAKVAALIRGVLERTPSTDVDARFGRRG